MKIIKRFLICVLATCITIGFFPTTAHAASSGTCGEHLTWYISDSHELVIEGYGDMYNLTYSVEQPWRWANQMSSIKSIRLPEGLTSIGDRMFQYLSGLTEIKIPESVTRIGFCAFDGCTNLAKIQLSETPLTGLNGSPFRGSAITSVGPVGSGADCEYGWTEVIPNYIFNGCSRLTKAVIPDGMREIGAGAFCDCINLTDIDIPNTVTEIGYAAFQNCRSLENIELPENITAIHLGTFERCKMLQKVDIPYGVTEIGQSAFSGCENLKQITIPSTVTEVDEYAYGFSSYLTSAGPTASNCAIEFGWNDQFPYAAFSSCYYLESVLIPSGISKINSSQFKYCDNLTSVYFEGDAPSVIEASRSTRSFPEDAVLYYIPGTSGWIDSEAYDEQSGTWNGYKLEAWDILAITRQFPEPNSTFSGNNLMVTIAFNHEIETVNTGLDNGNFTIARKVEDADDWKFETVYSLSEGDHLENDVTIDGNTVKIDVSSAELLPGATYYIHMDNGVIKFKDTIETIGFGGTEWKFKMGSANGGSYKGVYGCTFSYSDEYFTGGNSDVYNHNLAIASCNLAISAYNNVRAKATGYHAEVAGKDIKEMLKQLDFDEASIDISSYDGAPTKTSIAAAFAKKTFSCNDEEWTLLAIAIRGGEYQAEWGGNFWLNETGNHAGFQHAANQVEEMLKQYLQEHPVTGKIAVWLTGYSRAAATANLLAGELNTDFGAEYVGLDIQSENIYTYTFETPRGLDTSSNAGGSRVASAKTFSNIFNILNPRDLVPKVAPEAMSFGRNGVDLYFPDNSSSSGYSYYASIAHSNYQSFIGHSVPDEFTTYTLTHDGTHIYMINGLDGEKVHGYYLDQFINRGVCGKLISSREEYVEKLQPIVSDVMASVCSGIVDKDALSKQLFDDMATQSFEWLVRYGVFKVVKTTFGEKIAKTADKLMFNDAKQELADLLTDVLLENRAIEEANVDQVKDSIYEVLNLAPVASFLVSNVNEIYTLVSNSDWLRTGHEPQYCLAWLYAISDDPEVAYECGGKYRVVKVNCPVDINVYDSQNKLVASIIADKVQNITDSTIGAMIDETEQKVIILPADEEYRVDITATGNGEMSYSISEYSESDGVYMRAVNYYGITIQPGDTLTGTVENAIDTTPEYKLVGNNGEIIDIDEDLKQDEIIYYSVEISVEGNGLVSGDGKFISGEYALVSAVPDTNEEFLGWYINGEKISTDLEYRFCIKRNVILIAKFTNTDKDVTVKPNGSVTPTPHEPEQPENPFNDVNKDDYSFDAVIWAVENGITSGTSASTFEPNKICTRAEMVTFLWRTAGEPEPTSRNNPFADVSEKDYFYKAVLWAVENGITKGTSATTFSPNDTCTRAQAATFLYRYAGSSKADSTNPFADVVETDYFYHAVIWAVDEEITKGTSATAFSPNDFCTRAQIVTFLYRYQQN